MSEQASVDPDRKTVRCKFSVDKKWMDRLETLRQKGGHASIEAVVTRALTIYWKTLSLFGDHRNAVRLWWPDDEWGDGERWVYLDVFFRVPERGMVSVQSQPQIVRSFAIDVPESDAERIRWMGGCVGATAFADLVGLAVGFYEELIHRRGSTYRGGWHLAIDREVPVTRRRWLMPWKTYTVMAWRGWHYYRVRRVLAEW